MPTSGDGRPLHLTEEQPSAAQPSALLSPDAGMAGSALDPSVIARIANELFGALPAGASPAPVHAVDQAAPPAAVRGVLAPSPETLRGAPAPVAVTSAVPSSASHPIGLPSSGAVPSSPEAGAPWLGGGATAPTALGTSPHGAPGPVPRPLPYAETLPALGSRGLPPLSPERVGTVPWLETESEAARPSGTWAAPGVDASTLRVFGSPLPLPGLVDPAAWAGSRGTGSSAAAPPPTAAREASPASTASGARDPSVPSLVPLLDLPAGAFDAASVRRDFPILEQRVHGRSLVWLDNAATTQKPRAVIDRLTEFYERENSNIHRGAHTLAARATDAYEGAREKVRRFLHAGSAQEIIFVRGATEGINLVAQTFGKRHIEAGDEIVLTTLEHHSNIVPWQLLAAERGAKIRVAPVDDDGQILLDAFEKLFNPRTRIASITHVSNALGTIAPVREMVAIAHRHGVPVLVDGAQAVSHLPVDVRALDCDFYVFSGHKVFGPTGIGVVYGKRELLETLPPWQGGGNMIVDVTFEKTVYATSPARFEAGTGNIADAVGLGAALDYLEQLGMGVIERYEHDLLAYATQALARIPGLRPVGTAKEKASVLSFVLDGFRSEEVGGALDREGIAVRSGHHCAQPALRRFGLETSVRPSLALYNTKDDVDALVRALLDLVALRSPTRGARSFRG